MAKVVLVWTIAISRDTIYGMKYGFNNKYSEGLGLNG